jgi:hypothetical protein
MEAVSVTFCWDLVRTNPSRFANGTSSDVDALKLIAPNGVVSTNDLQTLRAMHAATTRRESLWGDIGAVLERLQGEDYAKTVSIKVWTEF